MFSEIKIELASKVKKRLIKEKNKVYQSEFDMLRYMQLFQVYQSRIFGLCFYRTISSDSCLWSKLNEIEVSKTSEEVLDVNICFA